MQDNVVAIGLPVRQESYAIGFLTSLHLLRHIEDKGAIFFVSDLNWIQRLLSIEILSPLGSPRETRLGFIFVARDR